MEDPIATHYVLAPQPSPIPMGGLTAYPAFDRRDGSRALLAVQTKPALPPRPRLLTGRLAAPVPHAVMPLDHGVGRDPSGRNALFVFCPALPGASVAAAPKPWAESEVIRFLLLPAAAALDAFAERGLTHRAIRPDNVFRAGPGEKVTLGPCWAAPPASLQPAAFEPPYAAQCLPTGRGEGSIHDDVYALGVTMLWCVLGGPGEGWLDDAALLRQKMNMGSLAALLGQARISPTLADLLRGMLAEDPDHRPAPALLLDPDQARSRRVATRPAPRAQRPMEIGGQQAWFARELALVLGGAADTAATLLRNGGISGWIRRLVGDTPLAIRLDEAMLRAEMPGDPARPAHVLVARAITALDPLAPLVWRGYALFPDGIGTALVTAVLTGQTALTAALEEILTQDATAAWLHGRVPRAEYTRMQQDVRDWREWLYAKGVTGGLPRVLYGANPLLSCLSPILGGRAVPRLGDLLPMLEVCAAEADRKRPPIDAQIAAFIAARADQSVLAEANRLAGFVTQEDRLTVMGLFGRLQQRVGGDSLPKLAGWLVESGLPEMQRWRCMATRKALTGRLNALAAAGMITPMVLLLSDDPACARDAAGAQNAAVRLGDIELMLASLNGGAAKRRDAARQTGHDIATGLSLLCLLGGAITVALGG